MKRRSLRWLLAATAIAPASLGLSNLTTAQEPKSNGITEPVYRVSKNQSLNTPDQAPHSLDPALQMARQSLSVMNSSIQDYTAKIVKRERIDDKLGDYEYMFAKIRNRKVQAEKTTVPFSVYLAFLKPATVRGREVLYVENANQGKVLAHEGGLKKMLGTHALDPNGWLAMQGQRYPVTDIGIENLITKLIERGERDKRYGDCNVQFLTGAKVSGRECTVVQVEHPEKVGPYDFNIAQIFIDNEYSLPVRYAAYTWPKIKGGEPELLEEYTYQEIQFNVGLTDKDFDSNNPEYGFQKR